MADPTIKAMTLARTLDVRPAGVQDAEPGPEARRLPEGNAVGAVGHEG
jgi:hypothetical protein